ncbi:DUF1573 domain-containing protein [Candidatus Acetothermia bacterium]|jgi:rhodanese-related sulfurtransferase|nr:DUF1573 domain-containing protein [Candidatus Acetothermia bacterium]MCI2427771.1 DUF1573 domain-containing protein [Candidatus Acetothermia bacterium]MCI2428961.1 DUF1573 domain-containing protein [Candidatus Acetothermia bacterium]
MVHLTRSANSNATRYGATIGIAAMLVVGIPLLTLSLPRISVDADYHNFAPVIEGIAVIHTFILRNTGDQPLKIERVHTLCPSCILTSLSITTLEPGEEATLRVLFDTTSRYGAHSADIFIDSNDPKQPQLHLVLYGTIIPNKPYHITARELYLDFYLLIDLRTMAEYTSSRLIGAINIPYEKLPQWVAYLPRHHLIILYDDDGTLSDRAVKYLYAANFDHGLSLHGGLNYWRWRYNDQYLLKNGNDDIKRPMVLKRPLAEKRPYHICASQLRRFFHILVDVRTPTEYSRGHLKGALNVPHNEILLWRNDLRNLPRNVPIILYCQSGKRSSYAAHILRNAGFTTVKSLLGGLIEWQRRFDKELLFVP